MAHSTKQIIGRKVHVDSMLEWLVERGWTLYDAEYVNLDGAGYLYEVAFYKYTVTERCMGDTLFDAIEAMVHRAVVLDKTPKYRHTVNP